MKATEVMSALHSKGAYFEGPSLTWDKTMAPDVASELIRFLLKGYEPIPEHEIVTALSVGNSVYDIMPNIVPAYVFNVLLPIVDPSNTQEYLNAGKEALASMELHVSWYWYVEYNRPPVAENLDLYRELQCEFAANL